jgi:hypothetical protein
METSNTTLFIEWLNSRLANLDLREQRRTQRIINILFESQEPKKVRR